MLGITPTIAMSERDRATLKLAAGFAFYWLVCLRLDAESTAITQAFLGLTTWTFLAVVLRSSSWEERIQVATIIGVATFFECLFSLIWGAYEYRLGNLPIYVPAGHGLFYYTALRLAELSILRRHSRLIVDLPPKNWSRCNVSPGPERKGGKDGKEEAYGRADHQQAQRGGGGHIGREYGR